MSSITHTEFKYEVEILTIEELLKKEKLPAVVRICQRKQTKQINFSNGQEILLHHISKEMFARVKVLKFHDNDKMQNLKGAEYVLEHETHVGKEYLMPLEFPGYVKLVRRPGSRGRYLTIKQVIRECPAFVRVEEDTVAFLSNDMKQVVIVDAKTILELNKICKSPKANCMYTEFRDGHKTYIFTENDKVNFTTVEKDILHSLSAFSKTDLLPKVIQFEGVNPQNIVLKDHTFRSAVSTILDGPLEVLEFTYVENLTCWTRSKNLRTYETALIPQCLRNNVYVQRRYLPSEGDKEQYLSNKFGPCLQTKFVSNSLYFLQCSISEVAWLRCPEFFKQHFDGNTVYDVIEIPFNDSSDDDVIYEDIDEEESTQAEADHVEKPVNIATKEVKPVKYIRNKFRKMIRARKPLNKCDTTKKDFLQAPLPSDPGRKTVTCGNTSHYTRLELSNTAQVYESLDVYDDTLPLEFSKNIPDKGHLEPGQVKKVLEENQTQEDFYKYSVKEMSFCLEHCGLKSLADMCYDKKLDGSFFKGFSDWKELNMSNLDVIILKKVIYDGWRSKNDCI